MLVKTVRKMLFKTIAIAEGDGGSSLIVAKTAGDL